MTKARLRFDSDNFVLTNQRGASAQYWAGKGGYSEYRMNVVITKESFEKFATANWEDFDSKKIDKILLSARASPAVSSVARPPPDDDHVQQFVRSHGDRHMAARYGKILLVSPLKVVAL